jgi:hypothetical protein
LLVTVIEIDAKQYAKMEMGGLFVMFETGIIGLDLFEFDLDKKGSRCEDGDRSPKLRISMEPSSLFLSMVVAIKCSVRPDGVRKKQALGKGVSRDWRFSRREVEAFTCYSRASVGGIGSVSLYHELRRLAEEVRCWRS